MKLKERGDMNDYGWDKNLNISTMGRNDLHEDYHHFAYEPTAYSVLLRLAERGYISEENTLIDYGCGKGRVSFLLSRRTGCRAIGIEYNDEIYEIAVQNLEHFRGDRGKISFVNADAEHFDLPPEADRFYFFNPFSVRILYPVLERIYASYFEDPRQMYLFFYYPKDEDLALLSMFDEIMFYDEIDCTDLYGGRDQREKILVYELPSGE
jgi:SAM-dependent methyltransferase